MTKPLPTDSDPPKNSFLKSCLNCAFIQRWVKRSVGVCKHPSFARWGWIFIYALCALLAIAIFFQLHIDKFFAGPEAIALFGCEWLAISVVVISVALLHYFAGFQPAQLLRAPKYPGFPLAVFIALCAHACFSSFLNKVEHNDVELAWLIAVGYGNILMFLAGVASLRESQAKEAAARTPSLNESICLSEISTTKLMEWVQEEKEISDCQEDYLGYGVRAARVLRTLRDERRNSVAIVGPFGSGKSSLVNLVETEACRIQARVPRSSQPELWFCRFSCWGFEKGDSVPEAILRQVVEQLRRRIDCLAIRGLPSRYASALSKLHGFVDSILNLARPADPVEQLERLSPLLIAANARLVIVVEDIDRNGSDFDVHQIEGLFTRLREIEEITFVITAGQECKLDFLRLVEHAEVLPAMDADKMFDIIERARQQLVHDPDTVVIPSRPKLMDDPDDLDVTMQVYYREKRGYRPRDCWNWQLALLLNTPRVLKAALRRFQRSWVNLKGEVNIDQLLVACALRERSPRHFAFVQRRLPDFGWLAEPEKENQKGAKPSAVAKELREEWGELSDQGADRIATRKLLAALFPEIGPLIGEESPWKLECVQSVSDPKRGAIYRDRIFNEHVTSGPLLDQPMLRMIDDANNNDRGMPPLALKMIESAEQFELFAFFAESRLKRERQRPLLSETFKQLRLCDGRKATLHASPLGEFCFSCRVHSYDRIAHNDDWVAQEVLLCLPGHLRLGRDLMECFCAVAPEHLKAIRAKAAEAFRHHFAGVGASQLIKGFDEDSPGSLMWFLLGEADVSEWLGPLLIQAVREDPKVTIGEMQGVIFATAHTAKPEGIGLELQVMPAENMRLLLGQYAEQLMREVLEREPGNVEYRYDTELVSSAQVRQAASAWLEERSRSS